MLEEDDPIIPKRNDPKHGKKEYMYARTQWTCEKMLPIAQMDLKMEKSVSVEKNMSLELQKFFPLRTCFSIHGFSHCLKFKTLKDDYMSTAPNLSESSDTDNELQNKKKLGSIVIVIIGRKK